MAAVQQRILNWLYSVLTSEYHHVNRAYSDVAQALSYYSSLTPRTDVYTSEMGASALLLQLTGTLPVMFRGTNYRFPITLWIPHAYPQEPPVVYIVPVDGMVVRAGQHVDPQGKVYHPYLVAWTDNIHSNVLEFLAILRDTFAKEPPVVARQQRQRPVATTASFQAQANGPASPPCPPRSDEFTSQIPMYTTGLPPPPPPKEYSQPGLSQQNRDVRGENASQLPQFRDYHRSPLPQRQHAQQSQSQQQDVLRHDNLNSSRQWQRPAMAYGQKMPAPFDAQTRLSQQEASRSPRNFDVSQQMHPQSQLLQTFQYNNVPGPQLQLIPNSLQNSKSISKPLDLMNEPLETSVTSPATSTLPAPPVPTNPEKDILLQTIAKALHAVRQTSLSQTGSCIPSLAIQYTAMLQSSQILQNEMTQLYQLSNTLTLNTQILHSALRAADATIADAANRESPSIDDILVAPTVVSNQLYKEVCEERAIADTIFVMGRAVERGRISAPVFVKITRALAREWFEKKRLVKKIGKGMGLDMKDIGHGE